MRPQSYCRDEMRVMSVGPFRTARLSLLVLLRNRNARRRGRRQSLLLIAIRPPPDNKYQLMRRERVIYTALIAFSLLHAQHARYGRGNEGLRFHQKKFRPPKVHQIVVAQCRFLFVSSKLPSLGTSRRERIAMVYDDLASLQSVIDRRN